MDDEGRPPQGNNVQVDRHFPSSTLSWLGSNIAAIALAIGVAVLSTVVGQVIVGDTGRDKITKDSFIAEAEFAEKDKSELNEKLQALTKQVDAINSHLSAISSVPKEDSLYIEVQKENRSLGELDAREAKLEAIIIQSPQKALEIPLLRRDLDNLKDEQQANLTNLKYSIDRAYDINKWLLGAMAVSVVTLAIANLLKSKDGKP